MKALPTGPDCWPTVPILMTPPLLVQEAPGTAGIPAPGFVPAGAASPVCVGSPGFEVAWAADEPPTEAAVVGFARTAAPDELPLGALLPTTAPAAPFGAEGDCAPPGSALDVAGASPPSGNGSADRFTSDFSADPDSRTRVPQPAVARRRLNARIEARRAGPRS
jgi:hypothetical protein